MNIINYTDIATPERMKGAILNQEYTGFKEDYLTLHCLLKMFPVKRYLEIGTNMGTGTLIAKNALEDSDVWSLDLPLDKQHKSLQHLVKEGKADNTNYTTKVGSHCYLTYSQVFGDSMEFDYDSVFPEDFEDTKGAFIDGEHDYKHCYHESKEMFKRNVDLVIWHDADIIPVWNGIQDAVAWIKDYTLYRVPETRIAFALRDSQYSI